MMLEGTDSFRKLPRRLQSSTNFCIRNEIHLQLDADLLMCSRDAEVLRGGTFSRSGQGANHGVVESHPSDLRRAPQLWVSPNYSSFQAHELLHLTAGVLVNASKTSWVAMPSEPSPLHPGHRAPC